MFPFIILIIADKKVFIKNKISLSAIQN